jgi:hypothetical protein
MRAPIEIEEISTGLRITQQRSVAYFIQWFSLFLILGITPLAFSFAISTTKQTLTCERSILGKPPSCSYRLARMWGTTLQESYLQNVDGVVVVNQRTALMTSNSISDTISIKEDWVNPVQAFLSNPNQTIFEESNVQFSGTGMLFCVTSIWFSLMFLASLFLFSTRTTITEFNLDKQTASYISHSRLQKELSIPFENIIEASYNIFPSYILLRAKGEPPVFIGRYRIFGEEITPEAIELTDRINAWLKKHRIGQDLW